MYLTINRRFLLTIGNHSLFALDLQNISIQFDLSNSSIAYLSNCQIISNGILKISNSEKYGFAVNSSEEIIITDLNRIY